MDNMIKINKNTSYNIIADDEDTTSDFIDLTINFKSEYGSNCYDFRYHKTDRNIDILTNSWTYTQAFKNKRFKLLTQCLYKNQIELLKELEVKALIEMSYINLPI
tara:strand:+ start:495 stop:809 length:315 start_codon:yes stop_codon:yes gene_type:complete